MENKRGDVTDATLIIIILIFLAITFIVVIFVNTKIQNIISTTQLNQSDSYASINSAFNTINTQTTQRGFLLMFTFLIVGTLVSSFLVRVHPAFIFLAILLTMILIVVAVIGQNVYNQVASTPAFYDIARQQTLINTIMERLVLISVVVSGLSMMILFGKIVLPPAVGGGADLG